MSQKTKTPKKTSTEEKALYVYRNMMQILAELGDTTNLFGEVARAGGKTEGILGPRSIRIAYDMPQSTIVLGGPTYVSLMQNIVPNLLGFYNSPHPETGQPTLTEGIHYVVGQKDLPKHFKRPIVPVVDPKHSIVFCWGTYFRLASTDRPESVAGISAAHAIVEEMKHNDGQKLKTRLFPTLRGKRNLFGHSHYFEGITGISDTARIDLGEDDWFFDYEKNMNKDIITDILNIAIHLNKLRMLVHKGKDVEKNLKKIKKWQKTINAIRRNQTLYIKASTFVNKDILGHEFFLKQLQALSIDEFLTAIGNIRPKAVKEMFFGKFNKKKHVYSDSYRYDYIQKYDLKKGFKVTSRDLKHCNPKRPLYWGYDPGKFMSCVVGQKSPGKMRILKNFWVVHHHQHDELAEEFNNFFSDHSEKTIYLHYDRAGNQKKDKYELYGDLMDTDAKLMQAALEKLGWKVILMSIGKRTIYFWEHYNLLNILFGEKNRNTDRILIDENECEELISSIYKSPIKRTMGLIELDKKSEIELPLEKQARFSTQIATSLMYLLFGEYESYLPNSKIVASVYDTTIM